MFSRDSVYVVAEAGSNHDGNYRQAVQLIHVAYLAGADAVKFQCLPNLPHWWMTPLKSAAEMRGLDFLATPFDVDAVKVLDALDVPAIKIAAPELVNHELLDAVLKTGRPVILSTGMATMDEIDQALTRLRVMGDDDVALLQCTTSYPATPEQANLRAMQRMHEVFGVPVGLSDHTLGIAVPIAAAALGASVIEKHFTLDRTLQGPDHAFALEPADLRAMVEGIRAAEASLGTGRKDGPQDGEMYELRGRDLRWAA